MLDCLGFAHVVPRNAREPERDELKFLSKPACFVFLLSPCPSLPIFFGTD